MIVEGRSTWVDTLVLEGASPDQPLVIVTPYARHGIQRLRAARNLLEATFNCRRPVMRQPTRQQSRRYRHMLQAVDARQAGASYRQIAESIFGKGRVASDPWKSSALRDATLALVRDGMKLVNGGYRDLLQRFPER